jgi:hypothetical protein
MHIECETHFQSIEPFGPIEIHPFTLITGINGSGKTHLLRAIKNHHAKIFDGQNAVIPERIAYYDWNTLVPNEIDHISGDQVDQRNRLWGLYEETLRNFRLNEKGRSVPWENELQRRNALLSTGSYQADLNPVFNRILAYGQGDIFALTYDDFQKDMARAWQQQDIFKQSLAHIFAGYQRLMQENDLRRLDQVQGALSIEDFEEKFGPPPWDFVNEIIDTAGLRFHIEGPQRYSLSAFTPRLILNDTGICRLCSLASALARRSLCLLLWRCTIQALTQR